MLVLDTLHRAAPILGFLVAATVLAELADAARLFDVLATGMAKRGGGRTLRLYLGVLLIATVTTVVLSLDTTAVLLTPVVLALAQRSGLRPAPFAFAAVWLANTASLLLPVSNLTNLLALQTAHQSAGSYLRTMAAPALAAVAATVVLLVVWFRRDLSGGYPPPEPVEVPDRVLLRLAGGLCLAVGPCFAAGLPPWLVAGVAAVLLAGGFAARQRAALRWNLVPWRLTLGVGALLVAAAAAGPHGLNSLLRSVIGAGGSVRTATTATVAANTVNNLPAFLALQPVVHRADLPALLIGVNLGPLVLLHGSLATLLWRARCRARGLQVGWWEFARMGLVGVPLVVGAALLALRVS